MATLDLLQSISNSIEIVFVSNPIMQYNAIMLTQGPYEAFVSLLVKK